MTRIASAPYTVLQCAEPESHSCGISSEGISAAAGASNIRKLTIEARLEQSPVCVEAVKAPWGCGAYVGPVAASALKRGWLWIGANTGSRRMLK